MSKQREDLERAVVAANRTYQQGTDAIDHVASELLGLNRTDLRCLDVLLQRRSLTAGDLAEAAGLSPGAMTSVLDRLERAGYARRRRDEEDRRRVFAEPTEWAGEAAGRIYGPLAAMGEPLMKSLTDAELAKVGEFLVQASELLRERAAELREQLEREGPLEP